MYVYLQVSTMGLYVCIFTGKCKRTVLYNYLPPALWFK